MDVLTLFMLLVVRMAWHRLMPAGLAMMRASQLLEKSWRPGLQGLANQELPVSMQELLQNFVKKYPPPLKRGILWT